MITSPRNPRVVAAVRLNQRSARERDRRFLVEGPRGVLEALRARGRVTEVFHGPDTEAAGLAEVRTAAEAAGATVLPVSEAVMGRLASTVTPQGIVAVASFLDVAVESLPAGLACVPVLVEVRDPGNAGTILRSADAFGADAVVLTKGSVDVYNPKTVRASAGSLFHVPVVRETSLPGVVEALRGRGLRVLAASAVGEVAVGDAGLDRPTAVLLGNEAHGLGDDAAALADATVRIPIHERAESLNLAAAAATILFEAARQRTGSDGLAGIVAGAAHDLRSPLTAIRGFASTLAAHQDRLDDDQRRMMLDGIVYDASRMDVIVSQLVDAARIATGALRLRPETVDLTASAAQFARTQRPNTDLQVEVRGPSVLGWVDPARLRSILAAAVEAAAWWAREGPVVIVATEDPSPALEVRRAGSSLATREIDALFEPRAPGTGGGSKVGLFVGRALARASGGDLVAKAGEDLVFRLTVPRRLGRRPSGGRRGPE